jgi:signal transduction histidine kinase
MKTGSFRNRTNAFGVRLWLAVLVVGCILPLSGITAFLIFNFYQHEQSRLISNSIQQAHAIISLVDQDIASTEAALQALATDNSLANADFGAFYTRASKAVRNMPSNSIALVDAAGQLVFTTSRPFDEPLPKVAGTPLLKRILDTGKGGVSDLYIGPLVKHFIYTIAVPVHHKGSIAWILSATGAPAQLSELLKEQTLPDSWRAVVADSSDHVVARTHDIEIFAGKKLGPAFSLQTRSAAEGSFKSKNLNGVPVITVYSRSPVTHWSVIIGIPLEEMTAGLHQTLLWLIFSTLAALSAGLGFAWFISGDIARSIIALIPTAVAIGSNKTSRVPELRFKEAEQLAQALREASISLSQSQASLHEKDLQLTQATDAAHLGIWIRDFVENKIYASEQWRLLFGFSKTQTIEMDAVLQKLHPDDLQTVSRTLTELRPPRGEYDIEYRIQIPGSGIRWVASRGRVDYDAAGTALRTRGVSFDITLRKQAELDLQQQQIEIMHLSRVAVLGELSGALAHELNQPLTSILSNAQAALRFLKKDAVDLNEVREILQDIADEDIRAGEVIRRLRGLLTTGKIQTQSVDINVLVSEVGKLLRSDLINREIELRLECAAGLNQIEADPIQLQQVMINLIVNAGDAMKGKTGGSRIIVRTRLHQEGKIQVSVLDQGSGIPADKLEKIFDAFYTSKVHGMGLGLSICRNIIEANQGQIWAENNVDQGAGFHFYIPCNTDKTP